MGHKLIVTKRLFMKGVEKLKRDENDVDDFGGVERGSTAMKGGCIFTTS